VFTGKRVRGRILPMNKKAWSAKLKKYAVLAGVNEPRKSCHACLLRLPPEPGSRQHVRAFGSFG
jgi:hypothetical protein